jgi:hypothetical protein
MLFLNPSNEGHPLAFGLTARIFHLNPWVQREYSVQDIDSDSLIKIASIPFSLRELLFYRMNIVQICRTLMLRV